MFTNDAEHALNATQVIGNNRDAEQTEFSAMVKAVWPARSQDDNERYIRSLKAKLEVALQKCVRCHLRKMCMLSSYWVTMPGSTALT